VALQINKYTSHVPIPGKDLHNSQSMIQVTAYNKWVKARKVTRRVDLDISSATDDNAGSLSISKLA
jgi:hypothetical protein